jgi:Arylamine N-acetyltransferase
VAPETIDGPDLETLARLRRAHLTTVPFETLAIMGDPCGEQEGEGVVLAVFHLYEKIVERRRGGYCFELNGLFHALLAGLGYDVRRAVARTTSVLRTPANHHTNVIDLDRRYVVDVGTGTPTVALSTETGYRKLSGDAFEEFSGEGRQERTVTGDAWHEILEQKFGLRYRSG